MTPDEEEALIKASIDEAIAGSGKSVSQLRAERAQEIALEQQIDEMWAHIELHMDAIRRGEFKPDYSWMGVDAWPVVQSLLFGLVGRSPGDTVH